MATPEKSDVEAQTPADMTMYVVEVEDYHTYVTFAEKAEQAADKVGITGQRALSTEPVEFSHEIALIRGRPHSLAEVVSELIRLQDGLAALDASDHPSVQRVLTDMNKMWSYAG